MSRRKGYLERGYKNLFEYATRRLNLSEGSVARRIQVANVSRRFPQILVVLAENRMSLTVAGLLAPVLTEGNVEKLLSDCGGMTKREAEEYLVALRPKPVFTPSIRKVPSQPALTASPTVQAASLQPPRPQAATPRTVPRVSRSILEPARPDQFNFRFAADRKFKEKFERLAEVLGVENPLQHMAEIMEQAMDIALDKKDVKRKRARRLERKSRSGDNSRQKACPGKISAKSRYIPSHVRERVHARAAYQCEYTSPDGTRCRSRTGTRGRARTALCFVPKPRREVSEAFLSSAQSLERREGVWCRVHPREDRGLPAEAVAKRPRRLIVASDLPKSGVVPKTFMPYDAGLTGRKDNASHGRQETRILRDPRPHWRWRHGRPGFLHR